MRRVLIPTTTENPDITPETTTQINTQDEAESLGNSYLPFIDAAYMGASDPQSGQKELDKHIEGWSYMSEMSTTENQVFFHDSDTDAIIVAPGTRGVADAAKTWASIMSEEQYAVASTAGSVAAKFFPGVAASSTTAYTFAKAMSPSQTAEERIDSMHGMIDLVKRQRGQDANILLMGHSLGGYVARMTARESGLSSVIYNSAVGRGRVYRGNTSKNVELRVRGDIVSGAPWVKQREYTLNRGMIRNPLSAHRTDQFAKDPEFYMKVRSGEVVLQRTNKYIEREYFRSHTNKTVDNPSIRGDFVDRSCNKPGFRRVAGVCVKY